LVDFNFDKSFENPIVGIDEVGRGSWAGPVVAGACLLNHNISLPKKLNDSKKLSTKIRHKIFEELKKTVIFGIGESSNNEIDILGIQKATFIAMERAYIDLRKKVDQVEISTLLIDGNENPRFQDTFGANIKLIIKGDTISPSIAAASIIAKCTRDLYMLEMNSVYKGYGFDSNKGYGTKIHKNKLFESGPTQLHRMTFSPMKYIH